MVLVKRTPPKNDPRAMPAIAPPPRPLSLVGLGVSVAVVVLPEAVSEAACEAVPDAVSDAVLGGSDLSVAPTALSSVVDDIDSADVSAVAAAQEC